MKVNENIVGPVDGVKYVMFWLRQIYCTGALRVVPRAAVIIHSCFKVGQRATPGELAGLPNWQGSQVDGLANLAGWPNW